ncbi:programmed cell death protein 4-like [Centruroides vittatus]|uniref:programmed cell death protein 4-like n=1 Tax=Centruroides vittatus TaxID=120091 RepID=UPI00350F7787
MTSLGLTNGTVEVADSNLVDGSELDGNGTLDSLTGSNITADDRLKRKAKRPSKLLACKEASAGSVCGSNGTVLRFAKNSRRPRNGHGRGLPKKGGAGGKGTWGKIGIEMTMDDMVANDVHDPNYDSDSQGSCEFESIVPELTEEEFERNIDPILQEYFENGDTQEVMISLNELNLGRQKPKLVVTVIQLAMDRKPSHCEMTSILLSDLYGQILSQENIAKGFDTLLMSLSDLVLDTPDAPTVLGNFIARAVADDCLPPKFVQGYKGKVECEHARAALEHADTLLSMKHGLVRLDNVWGVGGGMRPVKYLIRQIQLLLQEYLSSGDIAEATRCLQELEVPHFHHELVYEAVVMVIEDMGERAMDLMCKLLTFLSSSIIITPDQMKNGFERVYNEMADICIDVPPAYVILEKFVNKCHNCGFLPQELVKNIPSRGRKRFISEGDGGRIKEEFY